MSAARHATLPPARVSLQLEADSRYAMEAGWSADSSDFDRRDHVPISLSSERHSICRSAGATAGILRSSGGRMGNGKLCARRLDFDRGCLGDGFDDPHRSAYRSGIMRDIAISNSNEYRRFFRVPKPCTSSTVQSFWTSPLIPVTWTPRSGGICGTLERRRVVRPLLPKTPHILTAQTLDAASHFLPQTNFSETR
jgi:hypothetical protein